MSPKPKTPESITEAVSRKREAIVSAARTDKAAALSPYYGEALLTMEQYLRSQGKRCTVERRFVLQTLYRLTSPIDISALHQLVCDQCGSVALTTVYNTLELLVQLRLAKRLPLVSHGMTFFEATLGQEPHGYAICEGCGAIRVLHKPDVFQLIQGQLPRGFRPDDVTLHVHGLCGKCQRARSRKRQSKK